MRGTDSTEPATAAAGRSSAAGPGLSGTVLSEGRDVALRVGREDLPGGNAVTVEEGQAGLLVAGERVVRDVRQGRIALGGFWTKFLRRETPDAVLVDLGHVHVSAVVKGLAGLGVDLVDVRLDATVVVVDPARFFERVVSGHRRVDRRDLTRIVEALTRSPLEDALDGERMRDMVADPEARSRVAGLVRGTLERGVSARGLQLVEMTVREIAVSEDPISAPAGTESEDAESAEPVRDLIAAFGAVPEEPKPPEPRGRGAAMSRVVAVVVALAGLVGLLAGLIVPDLIGPQGMQALLGLLAVAGVLLVVEAVRVLQDSTADAIHQRRVKAARRLHRAHRLQAHRLVKERVPDDLAVCAKNLRQGGTELTGADSAAAMTLREAAERVDRLAARIRAGMSVDRLLPRTGALTEGARQVARCDARMARASAQLGGLGRMIARESEALAVGELEPLLETLNELVRATEQVVHDREAPLRG